MLADDSSYDTMRVKYASLIHRQKQSCGVSLFVAFTNRPLVVTAKAICGNGSSFDNKVGDVSRPCAWLHY